MSNYNSAYTGTEIDRVVGYGITVTSNIQTQLDSKQSTLTLGDLTELTSNVLTLSGNVGSIIGSGLQITVKQASAVQNGYLSSADWSTFNSKQSAITGGASTITSLDLTSNRVLISGATGKVEVSTITTTTLGYLDATSSIQTQLDAKEGTLTKGNLTELTSSILTIGNGTNSVIGTGTTITVSQATTSTSGYLSSTDWNTFNSKQDAITGAASTITSSNLTADRVVITNGSGKIAESSITTTTLGYLDATSSIQTQLDGKEPTLTKGNLTEAISSILTITNGTNAVIGTGTSIEIQESSISTSGYLSSTNFSIFNNKQDALDFSNLDGTTDQINVSNGTNVIVSATPVTLSLPQSIATTSDVTFNSLNLGGLTVDRVIVTDGSKNLSSSSVTSTTLTYLDIASSLTGLLALKQDNLDFSNLSGTSNQVTVSYGTNVLVGSTPVTLSLEQDIATTSDVTFNSLNLGGLTANRALITDASKNLISSITSDTELGYVSGVTSAIQTQIDGKQPLHDISDIEGTTNQVTITNGTNTIIGATPVTVSLPSNVYLGSGSIGRDANNLMDLSVNNEISFKTNNTANQLVINSDGNIGINTNDIENWASGFIALQFPVAAIVAGSTTNDLCLVNNAYNDGAMKFRADGYSQKISLETDGAIDFQISKESGIANNPITWNSVLSIDNTGLVTIENKNVNDNLYGFSVITELEESNNVTNGIGFFNSSGSYVSSGNTSLYQFGINVRNYIDSTSHEGTYGNVTGVIGLTGINQCGVGGAITNNIGIASVVYVEDGNGSIENSYMFRGLIYGATPTIITNNWGIYLVGSNMNYIEGTMQLPSLTASRVVTTDGSSILTSSSVTTTELALLSGLSGTIWTSNNDGTGSGLDADLLDSHDSSYFQTALNFTDLSGTSNQVILSTSGTGALVGSTPITLSLPQSIDTGADVTFGSLNLADLTASRALIVDGSNNITVSSVTSTELSYVSGVTSSIQTQIDNLLDTADALVYKGAIDASTNPNYPSADAGHVYKISADGKIGGASGENVEIGDMIICSVDSSPSGDQATVGANWFIQQVNIDGAVTSSSTSSSDNTIARFDGTSGQIIQNSVVSLSDAGTIDIPSGEEYRINGVALSYSDVGAEQAFNKSNIVGTSNQVTVSTNTDTIIGSTPITLSLPQSIATTSNVQFGTIGIGTTGDTNNIGNFQSDQNSYTAIRVRNDTDDTSSSAEMIVSYGNLSQYASMSQLSPSHGTDGLLVANSACFTSVNNSNGLRILTYDANSLIVGTNNTASITIDSSQNATFSANVNIASLTASRAVVTDGSKNLSSSSITSTELGLLSGLSGTIWTSNNDGSGSTLDADTLDGLHASDFNTASYVSDLSGTSNQINLSATGTGVLVGSTPITLSLPQDIATTSNVQFGGLGIGVASTSSIIGNFQKNQNTETILKVRNDTIGSGASSVLIASYSTTQYAILTERNPSYSTYGLNVANSACLLSNGNANGLRVFTEDATSLIFGTNNTEKMHIDSSGNVNISGLTASRAVVTDASKNLASSSTTLSELEFLNGITENVQTALDSKQKELYKIVDASGNGDYTGLKEAIDDGATNIYILDGTYTEATPIELTTDNIQILGQSILNTIVQFGVGQDGIRIYANGCKLENFTLDAQTNTASAALVLGDGQSTGNPDTTKGNNNTVNCCRVLGVNDTFGVYVAGASYLAGTPTLNAYEDNDLQYNNKITNCILESAWNFDSFSFSLQKNGVFSNNYCVGGRIAFYMCRDSECSNNIIIDSASQGIFIGCPVYNNTIMNNKIYNSTTSGIKMENQVEHEPLSAGQQGFNNNISNNVIYTTGSHGIEITGTSANPHTNNNFTNNTIAYTDFHGIYLNYANNNNINENLIYQPKTDTGNTRGSGIYMVNDVYDSSFNGNIIVDERSYQLHTAIANRETTTCTRNSIIGNKINALNAERTIWIQSNECIVSNNYVSGGYYAGIYLDGADNCNVTGNICENNTNEANNAYYEIWLNASASNNIVSNNTCISSDANVANADVLDSGTGNKTENNIGIGTTTEHPTILRGLQNMGTTTGLVTQTGNTSFAKRTITGTANQIIVSNGDGASGNPTLTTPQDIGTSSSVSFASLNLSGLTATRVVLTDGSKNLSSSTITSSELSYLTGLNQYLTTTSSVTFADLDVNGFCTIDRTATVGTALEVYANSTGAGTSMGVYGKVNNIQDSAYGYALRGYINTENSSSATGLYIYNDYVTNAGTQYGIYQESKNNQATNYIEGATTFVSNITINALTASKMVTTDGSKVLTTTYDVNQSLATTSSPTFNGVNLTDSMYMQKDQNTSTILRVRNDTNDVASSSLIGVSYGDWTNYCIMEKFSPSTSTDGLQTANSSCIRSTGGSLIFVTKDANDVIIGTNNTAVLTMDSSQLSTFSDSVYIHKDQNATNLFKIRNDTNGNLATCMVSLEYGDATGYLRLANWAGNVGTSGLTTGSASGIYTNGNTNGLRIFTLDAYSLILGTNNTARMTFANNSNIITATTITLNDTSKTGRSLYAYTTGAAVGDLNGIISARASDNNSNWVSIGCESANNYGWISSANGSGYTDLYIYNSGTYLKDGTHSFKIDFLSGIYIGAESNHALYLQTNNATRMTIDNTGIGTLSTSIDSALSFIVDNPNTGTSATSVLQVTNDSDNYLKIIKHGSNVAGWENKAYIENFVGDFIIYNYSAANLIFGTNNTARMTITSAGDIDITNSYTDTNQQAFSITSSMTTTTSAANQFIGAYLALSGSYVTSGQTNSSTIFGVDTSNFINSTNHQGTLNAQRGYNASIGIETCGASGTVSNAYGYYSRALNNDADGTITNLYQFYSEVVGSSGTITNNWGLYIGGCDKNYIAGNVGIGTTDIEAWNSGFTALEFNQSAFMTSNADDSIYIISNAYYDGAWKRKTENQAAMMYLYDGYFSLNVVSSDVINSVITWNEALRINNDTTTSFANSMYIQKDQNDGTYLRVLNETSDTGAFSAIGVSTNAWSEALRLYQLSDGFTTSGLYAASSSCIVANGSTAGLRIFTSDAYSLILGTNNIAALTIDSSQISTFVGNVSISKSFANANFTVSANTTGTEGSISITSYNDAYAYLNFGDNDNSTIAKIAYDNTNDKMLFLTNTATALTIDSSQISSFSNSVYIQKDQDASTVCEIRNDTSGTGASSVLWLKYSTIGYCVLAQRNPSYSTFGLNVANSVCFLSTGNTNGLRLFTEDATSLIVGTNNTAALTIDSSQVSTFAGNVIISKSGNASLTIEGTASTNQAHLYLKSYSNALAYINFGDQNDDNIGQIYYNNNTDAMVFIVNSGAAMTINSSKQVGIGNASPSYLLDIYETSTDTATYTQRIDTQTITTNIASHACSGLYSNLSTSYVTASDVNTGFIVAVNSNAEINNANHAGTFAAVVGNYNTVGFGSSTTSGTISNAYANYSKITLDGSGASISSAYLFYGLYSGTASTIASASKHGIYISGETDNSFSGLVSVGDFRISTPTVPSSASDTGTAGDIAWDSGYIYVCTATDTWKRATISTWA